MLSVKRVLVLGAWLGCLPATAITATAQPGPGQPDRSVLPSVGVFESALSQGEVGRYDLQYGRSYLATDQAASTNDGVVSPANRRPVARDDAAKTVQDTRKVIRVLRNDRDAEGDTLTVVSVSRPVKGGRARILEGTRVRYIPPAGFTGVDEFTYTITDGNLSDTARVSVTVEEQVSSSVDCTPVQQEVRGSGGCYLALVAPPNCSVVADGWSVIQIEWTTGTTFCEGPHHVYIASHPAAESPVWDIPIDDTGGNFRSLGSNGSGFAMTRNIGGYLRLARADFDAIRRQLPASSTGQYHFAIGGFFSVDNGGSISESRTIVFPPLR